MKISMYQLGTASDKMDRIPLIIIVFQILELRIISSIVVNVTVKESILSGCALILNHFSFIIVHILGAALTYHLVVKSIFLLASLASIFFLQNFH